MYSHAETGNATRAAKTAGAGQGTHDLDVRPSLSATAGVPRYQDYVDGAWRSTGRDTSLLRMTVFDHEGIAIVTISAQSLPAPIDKLSTRLDRG